MNTKPEIRDGKAFCSYNCPCMGVSAKGDGSCGQATCLAVLGRFKKKPNSPCYAELQGLVDKANQTQAAGI